MSGEAPIDVSIIVLTYFHEKYIRQALDSILEQETSLRYEILVGDDASQDRTPEIIQEYARRYPDLIKPVLRKKNLGTTRNSVDIALRARGKYIASLEGDDFWSDPHKLQNQWEFLEEHPEYSACCGKCVIVDEEGRPDYTRAPHFAKSKKIFTLEDFLDSWALPGQSGTFLKRNLWPEFDREEIEIFYRAHPIVGDKTTALLWLSRGPIYCSNEILSAYRFVIKKDGHNWFSIHHNNPYWQYDGFMYPCRLEAWAKKKLGLTRHLGNRKDYHFCSFVQDLVRTPSLRRLRYLGDMIVHSHQPVKYSLYILKAIIEMEDMK